MRILYYFYELNTPMYQWQRYNLIDELKSLGWEVDTINPATYYHTLKNVTQTYCKVYYQIKVTTISLSLVMKIQFCSPSTIHRNKEKVFDTNRLDLLG
jgi:hypothetical protein